MKTKSILLGLILTAAVATLSFTYASNKKDTKTTSQSEKVYTTEPAGGLAIDDKL